MKSWVALLFAACQVFGQEAGKLAYHGDPLGMTLGAFKQKYANASVEPFRDKGFVARPESYKPNLVSKTPVVLPSGKAGIPAYFFRLSPQGPEDARLFSILAPFFTTEYAGLKTAYTKQYGEPGKIEQNTVQDRTGHSFDAETLTWTFGKARLILRQRANQTDKGMLDLLDEDLQGDLNLEPPTQKK